MKNIVNKLKNGFENKNPETTQLGFKLLPDKPIEPDRQEDIRFGHHEIADTIFNLIKSATPPLTMGLYGNWGTGKTTIAKLVEESVKKIGYKTLYFDVWKYERDTLRRQFLIEMDKQVFEGKLHLRERLNQSLTKSEKISLWEFVKRVFESMALKLLAVLVFLLLIGLFIDFGTYDSAVDALFSLGLLGIFTTYILSSFNVITGSIQEHKTDSAEGFEYQFKKAFEEKELKNQTLFVVVDNLDRVEDTKVIDVLSDIKTFLTSDGGQQKVVFLIPCDYESLRIRLSELHGDDFDADEFFRKFFNLSVRIPKFIDLDLFSYIRSLLEEAEVDEYKENHDLEGVIYSTLKDNPREIKQFINSLTTQVLLAKQRGLVTVTDNVAFLAKLLVMRQKFPVLYSILEERSIRSLVTLDDDDLVKYFKSELKLQGWEDLKIDKEITDFENLNKLTPGINIDNLDVFLTLKQSDDEKEIPEWTSYVLAAEEARVDDANKIFIQVQKDGKLQIFSRLLKSRIDKVRKGSTLTNLVSTTLTIAQKQKVTLQEFFDEAATHFPFGDSLTNTYDEFDSRLVFDFWYPKTNKSKQDNIVKPFAQLLGTSSGSNESALETDYVLTLLDIISEKPQTFSKHQQSIKEHVTSYFHSYPYLPRLKSDAALKKFVKRDAAAKFVDSLSLEDFSDVQDLKEALQYVNRLTLKEGAILNGFKKFRELVKSIESEGADDMKLEVTKQFVEFCKKYANEVNKESDDSTFTQEISAISASIGNYYDQTSEDNRISLMSSIDYLSNWEKNNNRNVMNDKISHFIKNADNGTLKKISMRQLKDWTQKETVTRAVLQRSQTDPHILLEKRLYEVLNNEQKQTVVVGLISNNQTPLDVLEKIGYEIHDADTVIENLLRRVPELGLSGLSKTLQATEKLGIGSLSNRIEELKTKLIENKRQHAEKEDEINELIKKYKKLFNEGQRADLGIE